MGNAHGHGSTIEQWLPVGGGWPLVAVVGWRLAVGRPWGLSLRAVLKEKELELLRTALISCALWKSLLRVQEPAAALG